MKVLIKCKSLLLQQTLNYYLKDKIDKKNFELIITDYETTSSKFPIFVIGKDLKKPFTKNDLLEKLADFKIEENIQKEYQSLDEKIDKLVENFKKDLIKTIKEHYAKK